MASKQNLSVNELLILSSEQRDSQKSLALCYLMLLGGHLGLPRFYLKRFKTAVIQLILFIIAFLSYIGLAVGSEVEMYKLLIISMISLIIFGLALLIWIIIDIFLIPRMVKDWNDRLEHELIHEIIAARPSSNPDYRR